jgi:hypothetical protein
MTDQRAGHAEAQEAIARQHRYIACGPTRPDRDAAEFQHTHNLPGVPPGSIVRPCG